MASKWIKCFVLESWTGTSTVLSVWTSTVVKPLVLKVVTPALWRMAVMSPSMSNLSLGYLELILVIWFFQIEAAEAKLALYVSRSFRAWSYLAYLLRASSSFSPVYDLSLRVKFSALRATILFSSSIYLAVALLNLSSKFWIFFSSSTIWVSFSLRRLVKSKFLAPPS